MAGSRLDRIGTIFSRTTGLLKAGAVKYQDRPLWYDIYRVFPPKYEPHVDREADTKEVKEILYKEDTFRALCFKRFGQNPGGTARRFSDRNFEEPSQSIVSACMELRNSHPDWDDEKVFELAAENYNSMPASAQKFDKDVPEEDDIDEKSAARLHGRKPPTITAQSLLSLFKEAKEQQEKTAEEMQTPSSDTKKAD